MSKCHQKDLISLKNTFCLVLKLWTIEHNKQNEKPSETVFCWERAKSFRESNKMIFKYLKQNIAIYFVNKMRFKEHSNISLFQN
jgi:hypothetical protein